MSYITDLRHLLNEEGAIPEEMPQPARELASFLALVVDAVTSSYPESIPRYAAIDRRRGSNRPPKRKYHP